MNLTRAHIEVFCVVFCKLASIRAGEQLEELMKAVKGWFYGAKMQFWRRRFINHAWNWWWCFFPWKRRYLLTESDGDLRNGRSINGSFDTLHSSIKYPGDAIGFGENGAVADAEAQAEADPHNGASFDWGFSEDDEGHGVAAEDAAEEDVAELAARGHDHRGAVVADEDAGGEDGAEDAEGGKDQRDEGPRAEPLDDERLQFVAVGFILVGGVPGQAGFASVVEDVIVLPAGNAHPATLILKATIRCQNCPEI